MIKTISYKSHGGKATLVEYCPGNGTRYLLVLSEIKSTGDLCNQRIISWVNARKSMEIPNHWDCGPEQTELLIRMRAGYISQKLDCNMTDATAIAECLREIL